MDVKFGFHIKFYDRIQIFRLLGPTKLFLWPFKNRQIFQELMDFPYENKSGGKNFPPSSFLYGEAI